MYKPPAIDVAAGRGDAADAIGIVLLPDTKAVLDGVREYLFPSMVIAAAPGMSVWEPTMYCEAISGI